MKEYSDIVKTQAQAQVYPGTASGRVQWESPSNIAIVKYWGKYPGQIPANASLSMTLKHARTRTGIEYSFHPGIKGPELEFLFEGKQAPAFSGRIGKYLQSIQSCLPWLAQTKLKVSSENTFPHSSGIASSASSMSALAAGLCAIEKELTGLYEHDDFYRKASFLSRLGSGSASRSVYGKMAVWGRTAAWKDASDEYAIPVLSMHNDFEGMKDSILIIESGEKEVSSSLGHDLMKTNRYAETRFEVAENNMQRLAKVLEAGDMGQFIDIMEYEALQLHAMMMTSTPGYVLMKPNTLEAISRIRRFRRETGTAIGFTLDAGANVHVLYPANEKEKARAFIREELASLCENGRVIEDEMGEGTTEV